MKFHAEIRKNSKTSYFSLEARNLEEAIERLAYDINDPSVDRISLNLFDIKLEKEELLLLKQENSNLKSQISDLRKENIKLSSIIEESLGLDS